MPSEQKCLFFCWLGKNASFNSSEVYTEANCITELQLCRRALLSRINLTAAFILTQYLVAHFKLF